MRVARGSCGGTYAGDNALAEAGASVEPVVVLEFVDLDALSFARRRRSDVCHNRRRRVDTLRLGRVPSGGRRAVAIVCAMCSGQLAVDGAEVGGGRLGRLRVVLADDD